MPVFPLFCGDAETPVASFTGIPPPTDVDATDVAGTEDGGVTGTVPLGRIVDVVDCTTMLFDGIVLLFGGSWR